MAQDKIVVVGARENNLKNVSVEIPRDKLVVITGLSGSGKSSLAFDTIYAEGQRRYVESLSSYARQFLGQMDKPDVDHIEGLSPAVSIDQKSASRNPRSTVGTVTEIYDYLRILFARAGTPHCINGHGPIERQSTDQIVDVAGSLPVGTKLQILAPVVRGRKGEYKSVLQDVNKAGYVRVRVDGQMYEVTDDIPMDRYKQHTIEVVVDRIVVKESLERRLSDSIEAALKMGSGLVTLSIQPPLGAELPDIVQNMIAQQESAGVVTESTTYDLLFSEAYACPVCGFSLPELEPRLFSFNSPYGACPECTGLGTKTEFDPELIAPDPSKPLRDGAILPFVYKSGEVKDWWPEMLDAVGKACGFDARLPLSQVPPSGMDAVWNGLSQPIKVVMKYSKSERTFTSQWNGVLAALRKRYDETESEWVKADLEQYMATKACPVCRGKRLKPEALCVKVGSRDMSEIANLSIEDAFIFFDSLYEKLNSRQKAIGERAVKEIIERLRFLQDVGLAYLTLDRNARTLAGGEAQRIRLATQIGSGLMGCLYVLDEPSIGLHQRDNRKLINTLVRLRDIGNTVLVVEHDEETMRAADHLMELGPGAGEHGGYIVAQGTVEEFLKSDALTAQYLNGTREIEIPATRRSPGPLVVEATPEEQKPKEKKVKGLAAKIAADAKNRVAKTPRWITITNARGNNLQNVNVSIPLGLFCCVTGVSGSGKSTLVQDTLFPRLMYDVYGTRTIWEPHDSISGLEHFDKVIDIDQSPIGRTPRSNPATYTGTFDMIRELFALTPDAKTRGYKNGRFSFNVKGGRCEACKGDGVLKIEMVFLPDVYVPCEVCKGKRYNRETLEVRYKGKNIADVLGMTIEEACEFFKPIPKIYRKLETLQEVGLGYIRMGQAATTLSGGEAQRIKLAAELSKRSTGQTIYILDEPTTGLHFEDVKKLLVVLHRLVETGNTVLVIEHNLDVIKTADYLIDMGPEGGTGGGEVVGVGTPEELANNKRSYTGQFLAEIFDNKKHPYKTEAERALKVAEGKAKYSPKAKK
jgi:excinuclease ABC subunit A